MKVIFFRACVCTVIDHTWRQTFKFSQTLSRVCIRLYRHRASILYFFYKIRQRNMLWRHNHVCIARYKYGNWPITACVRHNLSYKHTCIVFYIGVISFFNLQLHEIIPAVATCVISRQVCAKPEIDNHWALREFGSKLLSQICRQV